jgi:hypothetical protein
VSPSSPISILADGQITTSGDTVRVDLIQPGGLPPSVRVSWPAKPTIVQPRRFAEVAGAAVRILAGANTELSRIKASKWR